MSVPILVIGDLLLDVMVTPAGPMRTDGDVPAAVRLLPGGQGGNLAVWLARRGRSVRLAAPVADDAAGALLRDACAADGVQLEPIAAARSGTVVILVEADGRRSMLSDRAAGLAPVRLIADAAIVCSAYALRDASGSELAQSLAGRAADSFLAIIGCAVEAGPAATELLARIRTSHPQLVICNRDEAAALVGSGGQDVQALAAALGSQLDTLALVTDPRRGSASSRGDVGVVPRADADGHSIDTTGSGDAYAAAVVDLLVDGDWPPEHGALEAAMRAGAVLAGRVARRSGAQARVPAESRDVAPEPTR